MRNLLLALLGVFAISCTTETVIVKNELRAPAYPLVTIDPYTSVWSASDNLYDRNITHWTGRDFTMIGTITVDGVDYRFMGIGEDSTSLTATQTLANVQATQTYYSFECGNVTLDLIFTAPFYDLENLDLISRPVNFITYKTKANDGKEHDIKVKLTPSKYWAIDNPDQDVNIDVFENNGLKYIKIGNKEQNILGKKGDYVRIDWGYFYLAGKDITADDDLLSLISNSPNGHFLIGYDDIYSIQYHGENLRPYWNRNNDKDIFEMFESAESSYKKDMVSCAEFDYDLMTECTIAGGKKYAELCALAYRQSIAAHKLVMLPSGEIDFFSKENFSNGSIGTVDVTYPSAPLYLKYNPKLAEGLMNHIFEYSEKGYWTKPFPAHDLGTYPIANGQTYPGDMPVEESGNMVILTAATCAAQGDYSYAKKHWDCLTGWTDYLVEFGGDPENQLCTDDFAGHFARNTNLSAKAIMGVACYGHMAGKLGDQETEEKYMNKAKEMAQEWIKKADNGDHYGLVFEADSTWSQKYNLIWDKIFGFGIFPPEVADKELKFYPSVFNQYGLPLDNRKTYTKSDWTIWTASLSSEKEEFEKFIEPMWNYYNETTDRFAMTDWYYTDKPKQVGFVARSVVGGYFIKLLDYKNK